MIDYIVYYKTNEIELDTIITLETDYIEDDLILEELLTEQLKDYFEIDDIEIVEFEELTQTEQANLYRITADDVYYNDDYMYKGDINNKAEKFMGKDMDDALDVIREYR